MHGQAPPGQRAFPGFIHNGPCTGWACSWTSRERTPRQRPSQGGGASATRGRILGPAEQTRLQLRGWPSNDSASDQMSVHPGGLSGSSPAVPSPKQPAAVVVGRQSLGRRCHRTRHHVPCAFPELPIFLVCRLIKATFSQVCVLSLQPDGHLCWRQDCFLCLLTVTVTFLDPHPARLQRNTTRAPGGHLVIVSGSPRPPPSSPGLPGRTAGIHGRRCKAHGREEAHGEKPGTGVSSQSPLPMELIPRHQS